MRHPGEWLQLAALVGDEKAAVPDATGTLGWFFRCWTYNQERELGNRPAALLSREQLAAVREQLLEDPPDALLIVTLYELFMTASWHGYLDQMEATADALAQVDAALPPEVSAGKNVVVDARLATLRGGATVSRRLEVAQSALEAGADRDWASLSWLHGTYAEQLIASWHLEEGLRSARTSMALVPGEDNERHWYVGAFSAMWSLWLMAEWDASVALAERCHDRGIALFHRFQAAVLRGDPPPSAVADEPRTAPSERSPDTYRWLRLCRRLAVAQSSVLTGEDEAQSRLREALDDVSVLEQRSGEGLILLAELATRLPTPEPGLARAIRRAGEELLWRGPIDDAWLAHLDAMLRRREGKDEPENWERATHAWDTIGAHVEAARCRVPWAEKLASAGERTRAEHELSRALAAFDRVGATPSSTAARGFAARARLSVPGEQPRPTAGHGGLTEREYEVLQLVVTGRTNDQIGQALFMSPRTASVHVSHILGKLGAANRTEIAAIAHRRGLVAR